MPKIQTENRNSGHRKEMCAHMRRAINIEHACVCNIPSNSSEKWICVHCVCDGVRALITIVFYSIHNLNERQSDSKK